MVGGPMASLRKTSWVLVGLLLLAAGAVGTLIALGPAPWFSSPTAIRPWSEREKILHPEKPAPIEIDTNLFPALTVTTNDGNLVLQTKEAQRPPGERIAWERVDADASLRANLGVGTVAVEYLGVGYGTPSDSADEEYALRVPGRFFTPDLEPIGEGELEAYGVQRWDRELDYRDGMPTLKLGLKLEGIEGLELLGVKSFDGRTYAPVSGGGYSHGGSEERYSIEMSLAVWHATPIELVLDLAVGPAEVFQFPARPGVTQRFPGGAVTVAAMTAGERRSWSSMSDGTQETVTLRFDPDADQGQCSVVFLVQPDAHPAPIDFEILDAKGEVLSGGGGGTSGRMAIQSVRAPLADVTIVRLLYYPHHRRVLFRLPELPGLPRPESPVENLFEVQVPYARFRYENSLRQWLEKTLQLEFRSNLSPTVAPGTFPLAFTNVTAGQILEAYLELYPRNMGGWVEEKEQKLVISRSKIAELGELVRKWIAGRFN